MSSFFDRSNYYKDIAHNNKLIAHERPVVDGSIVLRKSFHRINDQEEFDAAIINWAHYPCVVHLGYDLKFKQVPGAMPRRIINTALRFLAKTDKVTYPYEADAIEAAYDVAYTAMTQYVSKLIDDNENSYCNTLFVFSINLANAEQTGEVYDGVFGWDLHFFDEAKESGLVYDEEDWFSEVIIPPPPTFKISFQKESGATIFETDAISDLQAFLATYTFTENSIITFNGDDTFFLDDVWNLITINGAHGLIIQAAAGASPVIDVNYTAGTVFRSSINNLTVDGLTFQNADASDASGCIIRADSTANNTFKNLSLIGGFCAMRATAGVADLTLDNILVDQCADGAFRIGNGLAAGDDVTNLIIKNITFIDSLDGGIVQGIAPANLYLLIKKVNGLTIQDVNTGPFAIGTVELSSNVVIERCTASAFGKNVSTQGLYTTNCHNIIIKNNFLKSFADNVSKTLYTSQGDSNIKLLYNTFSLTNSNDGAVLMNDVKVIEELAGNIFTGTANSGSCLAITFNNNSYVATLAADYISEHHNLFEVLDQSSGGTVISFMRLSDVNSGGYQKIETIYGYTFAQYKTNLNRGSGSSFTNGAGNPTFEARLPGGVPVYLSAGSTGRNFIAAAISTITDDATGTLRTYPTDAGAYDRDI